MALSLTGCHEERDRLREEKAQLQGRVEALEKELQAQGALLEVTRASTGELQRILDLSRIAEQDTLAQARRLEADVATLRQQSADARADYEELEATLAPQAVLIELLRRHFRRTIPGTKLGELTLRDGRLLAEAVVVDMPSDQEIRLQHKGGVGVFAVTDLPEAARQTLLHAPDVAGMMVDPKALLAGEPVTPDEKDRVAQLKAQAEALAAQRQAQKEALERQEMERRRAETTQKIRDLERRAEMARLSLEATERAWESSSAMSRQSRIRVSEADQAKVTEKYERERRQHEAALLLYESQIRDLKATLSSPTP